MLGDTGANAAGALLGVAALVSARRRDRWALLSVLVALTAASEKVSFTRVIEGTPVLRELDAWGRRPSGAGR
jgi:UDP-N-acetylmuramyl pentapeptide phosphotransferase/UDP-N-acetylglucosamine-1-phosphate transferase